MTANDLSHSGLHIIDSEILVYSDLTIGRGSTLLFNGGKIKNGTEPQAPITIYDDDIILKAGPEQIFDGLFEFKAESEYPIAGTDPVRYEHYPVDWDMECAYPQWFGAKSCAFIAGSNSLINAEPDASEAINAAIRLKRVGRVMIPAGIYKITHFVNVLPGIELVGESPRFSWNKHYGTVLFPWHSGNPSPSGFPQRDNDNLREDSCEWPLSSMNFPPHPSDVDWYNNVEEPYDCGYMILAGFSDTCVVNYGAGDRFPKSITYAGYSAAQPLVAGTEIRNIAFTSAINTSKEHRFMRAILMVGAVKLSQIRVYELSQLCCSMTFADERYVERCSFAPPSFAQNPQTSDYNWGDYPQKIYAIDLEGGGDAMNLIGNHVATYSEKIGALKVRSCNGGTITGNILNSDVLIELCRGIDFAANHMEYGSRLSIASSAVAVRGNFIWRGEKAAITIRRWDRGGFYFYHGSVTLDNNQLFWRRQHYIIDSQGVHHSKLPQAAHFLFPYDVVTDGYASISVNNTFRNCNRDGYGEESYFGIKMGWLEMKGQPGDSSYLKEEDAYLETGGVYAAGTEYASISDFEEFNRVSHIASIGSKVQGRSVAPMTATMISSNFAYWRDETGANQLEMQLFKKNIVEGFETADGWKAEAGVKVNYEAWIFADFKRRILIREHIPLAAIYQQDSDLLTTAQNVNYKIAIGHGKDITNRNTNYSTNYNVPSGPYQCFMVRTAISAADDTVISRKGVLLPVCNSTQFWDDGQYLSGFEWAAITQNAINALSSVGNLRPTRVTYHGDNVECLIEYDIAYLPDTGVLMIGGEWQEGDIIRRIGGADAVAHSWIFNGLTWDEL